MSIKTTHHHVSTETQEQALKLAKAIQRPGQTKEQTKLITQGIQKGINLYKKQQKAKARELDKKLKKVSLQIEGGVQQGNESESETKPQIIYRHSMVAWGLLVLTWSGILGYLIWLLR